MTGFGLYLVIIYILGICVNFYYAGNGGMEVRPGALLFSAVWSIVNLIGIIFIGTGSV